MACEKPLSALRFSWLPRDAGLSHGMQDGRVFALRSVSCQISLERIISLMHPGDFFRSLDKAIFVLTATLSPEADLEEKGQVYELLTWISPTHPPAWNNSPTWMNVKRASHLYHQTPLRAPPPATWKGPCLLQVPF